MFHDARNHPCQESVICGHTVCMCHKLMVIIIISLLLPHCRQGLGLDNWGKGKCNLHDWAWWRRTQQEGQVRHSQKRVTGLCWVADLGWICLCLVIPCSPFYCGRPLGDYLVLDLSRWKLLPPHLLQRKNWEIPVNSSWMSNWQPARYTADNQLQVWRVTIEG